MTFSIVAYPGYLLYCEVADMVQSIRYQMKRIDSLGWWPLVSVGCRKRSDDPCQSAFGKRKRKDKIH
jgi:hypothetical protein